MNYPEQTSRIKVDGSRLAACSQTELKQLLRMRCANLADEKGDNVTANLFTWSKPIVEVLNALMRADTPPARSMDQVPYFLPPLYGETDA